MYKIHQRTGGRNRFRNIACAVLLCLSEIICSGRQDIEAAGMYMQSEALTEDSESGGFIPDEYSNQLQNYIPHTYGDCRTSFLGKYSSGGYQAVIYHEGKVYVQNMSDTYEIKSTKEIELELPIWGGVYLGETNNYIVCGDTYMSDLEGGGEVYRIIKYDKEFRRLDSISLTGRDTYTKVPFDGGNVSIDESGNFLTVYTSRMRTDGHQTNIAICINTDDMTVYHTSDAAYVEDSFRQICKYDQEELVYVDVADAEPLRSVYIQFDGKGTPLVDLAGESGSSVSDNGELSGLGISDTDYLVVGSYIKDEIYNIYLSVINKNSREVKKRWLMESSAFSAKVSANPRITKIRDDRFVVMWSGGNALYYILVDGGGNIVSERKEITAPITDCEPLYENGKILWLSAANGTVTIHEITDFSENGVYDPQEQELKQSDHAWDGTADLSWYDKNQTEFEITTAEQLAGLAQLANEGNTFEGKKINLQNDIFLNESPYEYANEWIPIARSGNDNDDGSDNNVFRGTFNGNKHKIYNMRTGDKNDGGLFGHIGQEGVVKCVDISQGHLYSGGCIANVNEGIISFCNNASATGSTKGYIGGICNTNYELVYGCKNFGMVWGWSSSAGGIVGTNRRKVSACSNHGLVSGDSAGIVYLNHGYIYNCYSKGLISDVLVKGGGIQSGREINGIAAVNNNILENCYFAGTLADSAGAWMGAYAVCRGQHAKALNCYTIPLERNRDKTVNEVSADEMKSMDFVRKLDRQTNSVFSVWREDTDNRNDGFPITAADVSYNTGQCKIQPEAWILDGKKLIEVNLSKKQYAFSFPCYYNESEPILTIENTEIAEVSETPGDFGEPVILLKKAGTTAVSIHFDETENNSSEDYQLTLTIHDDTEGDHTGPGDETDKRDIGKCSITLSPSYAFYTGEEIKLQITVEDGEKTLQEGVDYEVSYRDNIEIGLATVEITGKGDYAQTVTKRFAIVPAGAQTPKPSETPTQSRPPLQTAPTSAQPPSQTALPPGQTSSGPRIIIQKKTADTGDGADEDNDFEDEDEKLSKGDYLMAGNIGYKITKLKKKTGELAVVCVKSKKSKAYVIPGKVKKQGITFTITSIQANAFKGCKKAKTLTVKATGIRIIAKKALSGLDKKIQIKVPGTKVKKYRAMLQKCGYAKNIKSF